MPSDITTVEVSSQPVELCKLLKIANMVGGGGEAKIVIGEGYVILNNEVEFQKRKKVYHHDIVEFNGETIQVIVNEQLVKESLFEKTILENVTDERSVPGKKLKQPTTNKTSSTNNKKKKNKTSNKQSTKKVDESTLLQHNDRTKRRPISF
jgi:ribosome-associated protein